MSRATRLLALGGLFAALFLPLESVPAPTSDGMQQPVTVSPHPYCDALNATPAGSWDPNFDPILGDPSATVLAQLAPRNDNILHIGVSTTNLHTARLNKININGVVQSVLTGPAIDLSCRLATKLGMKIEFAASPVDHLPGYSDLTVMVSDFKNGAFDIGFAFDPIQPEPALLVANPYVNVPNTYIVRRASTFQQAADVNRAGVTVAVPIGSSPDTYLTNLQAAGQYLATLVRFQITGAAQTAFLAPGSTLDALASGRAGLTTFAAANGTTVRILADDLFTAHLAPFVHIGQGDGACYLADYVEAAKASGAIVNALARIVNCNATTGVCALAPPAGSTPAMAMPICSPNARCHDVTVSADGTCHASASIDAGSDDDDSDATCTPNPAGPYGLGKTMVTLTCVDKVSVLVSACNAIVTVVDDTPPVVACPAVITAECADEGAVETFAPTASDNCAIASVACSPPSGTKFPEGATTSGTCVAVDGSGNQASCGFQVSVQDTLPPTVTTNPGDAHGFIASLWPPDHKYHTVSLGDCIQAATDQCDSSAELKGAIVGVSSDEAAANAIAIAADGSSVQLAGERDGGGDGRVYTLFAVVSDVAGNATQVSCQVAVPHDQSGAPAIDSGAVYCVGSCY